MRKALTAFTLLAALSPAQNSGSSGATSEVSGRWVLSADYHGTPVDFSLEIKRDGDKLTGEFSGDKLEGALNGNKMHFVAKDDRGNVETCDGTVANGALSGTCLFADADDPTHPSTHQFTAALIPPRNSAPPRRHEFTPTVFYRQFSPLNKPVLRAAPGDTIHTTTVDAGGVDENGVTRVLGGNPETGPFFIETAAPGDVLVVRLNRLRLNRDWAGSDDFLVSRAVDTGLAVKMKDAGKSIRWHLDREHGVATPEKPAEHLAHYTIPLRPMLGCIATAPSASQAPPATGDSGRWGGNMDFNEIIEGATIYLPVNVTGALLYLGDGHAAQGDGELNGNALETSMDVEFTVDVLPKKRISGPRVESATHIMSMGLSGSLDDAFRSATSGMAQWLADDYKLTPSEIAQVLGTASEYRISEVADRNAGVVLKIDKARLHSLGAK